MLPRVSVVIPVFNDAAYLSSAVESVLSQNYPNLELIVVDDGSTDRSGEIADGYSDRCIVIHQANAGQSAALAVGWGRATGSFLGYLSSDDLLLPDAISIIVAGLLESDAVLAYPNFAIIDSSGQVRRHVEPPRYSRTKLYGELQCLPGPGAIFRREAYLKAGPWRRDMRQIPDLEFFLRLGLIGSFVHIPVELAAFRIHPRSTTYRPVPVSRADEPLRAVEYLLASTLPEDFRRYRRGMRSHAHYLTSVLHSQSGRRRSALRHILAAVTHNPASILSRQALGSVSTLMRGAPPQPD